MNKAELLIQLTQGESTQLECKLARGQNNQGELPKDFWKTYSAMANTHGGIVLLGVEEKQQRFTIVGIENISKIKKNLFDLANNKNHVSYNLLHDDHVKVYSIDNKNILMIKIPQATRKQKPIYLTKNPIGNTYLRLHEADVLCDEETIKRMLAEQVNDSLDNEILSEYYSFKDDIDQSTLQIYRNRLSAHKPDHPFLDLDLFDFFKKIGGWRMDRHSGKQGMTVAGLLMFGKFESIRDHFSYYFVDYRESSENRWQERIIPDGTWSGNLFDFYRKVYLRLTEDIKTPFLLNGDQRTETPAHEALRETLINTLVHANYSENTPILVEKKTDGFLFRNPGNLRITQQEFFAGGVHDCRNSILHQMFLLIGLGERAGSGVPKILKGCDEAHWQVPKIEEHFEAPQYIGLNIGFIFETLQSNQDSVNTKWGSSQEQVGTKSGLSQEQVGTKLENCLEQHPNYAILSDEQKSVLLQMKDEMSLNELMSFVSRSNKTKFRQQILNPLIELGFLQRTIPDKPTSSKQKYRLLRF